MGTRVDALRHTPPREIARKLGARARKRVFLRESHIWYKLDLNGDRRRREMPDGVALRTGGRGDIDDLNGIPGQPGPVDAHNQLDDGAELYLIVDEATGARAFACWIFHRHTPVIAARGGWLDLPEQVVCLEDSGTSSDFRGRGIAPAAWTAIADDLAARGFTTMITKVGEENVPSRKAVAKAGFEEAAVMRLRRTGVVSHVTMSPLHASGIQFLIESLVR